MQKIYIISGTCSQNLFQVHAGGMAVNRPWHGCFWQYILYICYTCHSCLHYTKKLRIFNILISSAWLCQQSYCRGAGVRRPSVRPSGKSVSSETVKHINATFCGKVAIHHISRPCLALLDYVSRAHEIAICPSSVVRPSVRPPVRPCRNYLWT